MTNELSLGELESELCAELPVRNLLRRRCRCRHSHRLHHAVGGGTSASNGSAANSNRTTQVNFNPQIVVNNGNAGTGGIHIDSHNQNNNTNNQTGIPINFSI